MERVCSLCLYDLARKDLSDSMFIFDYCFPEEDASGKERCDPWIWVNPRADGDTPDSQMGKVPFAFTG